MVQKTPYFMVSLVFSFVMHALLFWAYVLVPVDFFKTKDYAEYANEQQKESKIKTRLRFIQENVTPIQEISHNINPAKLIKKTHSRIQQDEVSDRTAATESQGENTVLAAYLSEVRNIIVKNKFKNKLASKLNLKGPVEVSFTIVKPNFIKDLFVIKSSGHSPLDQSALQTVNNISHLPPVPNVLELESLSVKFVVDYQ